MLPSGLYSSGGLDAFGLTRSANAVGSDFYDISAPRRPAW